MDSEQEELRVVGCCCSTLPARRPGWLLAEVPLENVAEPRRPESSLRSATFPPLGGRGGGRGAGVRSELVLLWGRNTSTTGTTGTSRTSRTSGTPGGEDVDLQQQSPAQEPVTPAQGGGAKSWEAEP